MLDGIRHVVWDWNGTLLDDVDAALLSINTMLEGRGMPVLGRDRYREIFGFPVIDCYRTLGFEFDTDEEWDAIANEFHRHYNINVDKAGLVRGALETLEAITARGIGMSVLSASESNRLNELLAHYRIDSCFMHVVGHDNLYGSSKINLGRELMRLLDLPPEAVLLVGDTVHDCEVARDAGWRCALYLNGHQDEARLSACGCAVISDLASLLA
jgi:phosphoglycolate phosphatase